MQWQLNNAWPSKITATDLDAEGEEVAIDTLEMVCEGIVITNEG